MIEVMVPRETVNDDSVIIGNVFVGNGGSVKKGQLVVAIETSKTSIAIDSPNDGLIFHDLMIGKEVNVGSCLFSIMVNDETSILKSIQSSHQIKETFSNAIFSKAAKKRIKELNIDSTLFKDEWVTVEAVEKKAGNQVKNVELDTQSNLITSQGPNDLIYLPLFTLEASSTRKRAEITNLLIGQHAATTSTIGIDIKVPGSRLIEPPFIFKTGISDLIVYEMSKLLRVYPELNGFYIDNKAWAKYDEINFGISFDNGANLKVLTLRNADKLLLAEVQTKIQELLDLYESDKTISSELLTSSTVTISDLSNQGVNFMLPLINGKQSLILGLICYCKNHFGIYASFDHRLAEGLTVSKLLSQLKMRILSYYLDENGEANIFCCACEKTMRDELRLGNRGMIKITLPSGEESHLCRNCFEGD